MGSERGALVLEIDKKESQLYRESSESNVWKTGKYKNTSQAKMSGILVSSRKKELAKLYARLEEIDNKNTSKKLSDSNG